MILPSAVGSPGDSCPIAGPQTTRTRSSFVRNSNSSSPLAGCDATSQYSPSACHRVPSAAAIRAAKEQGRRVIAVGTTSARLLESAWTPDGIQPFSADTRIFITPGFEFKQVDRLITNFHLPKSSLMMLVSAFAGYEHIMALYRHAIAQQYRFFSYGDAMLLTKEH